MATSLIIYVKKNATSTKNLTFVDIDRLLICDSTKVTDVIAEINKANVDEKQKDVMPIIFKADQI